jgi:hypothetical protein
MDGEGEVWSTCMYDVGYACMPASVSERENMLRKEEL